MIEREQASEHRTEDRGRTPEAVPSVPPVLALQRSAGNAAVTRMLQRRVMEARRGRAPRALTSVEDVMVYLGPTVLTEGERRALLGMIGDDKGRYYGEGEQNELLCDIRAQADAGRAFDEAKAAPPGDVLVQGDYMSGDRFGIAASLVAARQLGQPLSILLLHAPGNDGTANEMRTFYRGSTGDMKTPIKLLAVDSPQRCYRAMRPLLEGQRRIHSATYGTELVKRAQSKSPHDFQATLVDRWRGTDKEAAPVEGKLREWLRELGMKPGAYALMWVKTGAMSAEKSHHFTNRTAWEGLIERVRKETGRVPVLIGEDIGLETEPHLGKFWELEGFPNELKAEGRMGQLRLFMMLAGSKDYDVISVGMRSGAMEGPALVGVPTIYLEEAGNDQAERMEKWLEALPNFFRVIIDRPPGGAQLRAWQREAVERINDKAARLIAEYDRIQAGSKSAWARQRLNEINGQMGEIEHALRRFDEALRMSLHEGLRPDEQDEILLLLKLSRVDIVHGHRDLLEPGTRRRRQNRPEDRVGDFSPAGLRDEDNEALRDYLRFADWVVTRGPRLPPADPGTAHGLVDNVIAAVQAIRRYGSLDQWVNLDRVLAAARAGRVHGVVAAGLVPRLDGAIDAFTKRVENQRGTADDLRAWRREEQPTGVVTRANAAVLETLLEALGQHPASKPEAVAKWRQIRILTARLDTLELDGHTAAHAGGYGVRLRDLTRAAQLEMFSSDDLPSGAVERPAGTTAEKGEVAKVT